MAEPPRRGAPRARPIGRRSSPRHRPRLGGLPGRRLRGGRGPRRAPAPCRGRRDPPRLTGRRGVVGRLGRAARDRLSGPPGRPLAKERAPMAEPPRRGAPRVRAIGRRSDRVPIGRRDARGARRGRRDGPGAGRGRQQRREHGSRARRVRRVRRRPRHGRARQAEGRFEPAPRAHRTSHGCPSCRWRAIRVVSSAARFGSRKARIFAAWRSRMPSRIVVESSGSSSLRTVAASLGGMPS
jgi:hypothetical protein